MYRPACFLLTLLALLVVTPALALSPPPAVSKVPARFPVHELQPEQVLPQTMDIIFSGQERMRYEVRWTGGLEIGNIEVSITPDKEQKDGFNIEAHVKSTGTLDSWYPVDDHFRCLVVGKMKLPMLYTVRQQEGKKDRITNRVTNYNQAAKVVKYRKNKQKEELYSMTGTSYNEVSAYIISRALNFAAASAENPLIVPTFADKSRHEVKVKLLGREQRDTVFGKISTLKVEPVMKFKGLYDKTGSTVLWLTDDRCRVPVELRTSLVIGSLVARISGYSNPACPELKRGE